MVSFVLELISFKNSHYGYINVKAYIISNIFISNIPMTDDIIFTIVKFLLLLISPKLINQNLNHDKYCLHQYSLRHYFTTVVRAWNMYLITYVSFSHYKYSQVIARASCTNEARPDFWGCGSWFNHDLVILVWYCFLEYSTSQLLYSGFVWAMKYLGVFYWCEYPQIINR